MRLSSRELRAISGALMLAKNLRSATSKMLHVPDWERMQAASDAKEFQAIESKIRAVVPATAPKRGRPKGVPNTGASLVRKQPVVFRTRAKRVRKLLDSKP